MTLDDLRTLEIALELYKRDNPLQGKCDRLITTLLQVVRYDISTIKHKGGIPTKPAENKHSFRHDA